MTERDFLRRWSARKRAPATGCDQEPQSTSDAPAPPVEEPEAPPKTDTEILAEHGLPDPDTLEPDADFSAFMKAGLPEHLKNRALRRLWTSNPVLANLDGLNDYDEDYNIGSKGGVLRTAYKVGRGLIDQADPAPPAPQAEPAPTPAALEDADSPPEEGSADAEHENPDAVPDPGPDVEEVQPRTRRMAFRFDDTIG